MAKEPIAGLAFKKPRPSGPTIKISLAKMGSNATAPPKRTANKSREIAPKKTCSPNTKSIPDFMD